jgi:hypothetical protein
MLEEFRQAVLQQQSRFTMMLWLQNGHLSTVYLPQDTEHS